MAEHSRGPWIWLHDDEEDGRADCGCALVQQHGGSGAALFFCPLHEAAQELLAALEEFVRLRNLFRHGNPPVYACMICAYSTTQPHAAWCPIPQGEAAIAKAKGGET